MRITETPVVYLSGEIPQVGDIISRLGSGAIRWVVRYIEQRGLITVDNSRGIERLGRMTGKVSVRTKILEDPTRYVLLERSSMVRPFVVSSFIERLRGVELTQEEADCIMEAVTTRVRLNNRCVDCGNPTEYGGQPRCLKCWRIRCNYKERTVIMSETEFVRLRARVETAIGTGTQLNQDQASRLGASIQFRVVPDSLCLRCHQVESKHEKFTDTFGKIIPICQNSTFSPFPT